MLCMTKTNDHTWTHTDRKVVQGPDVSRSCQQTPKDGRYTVGKELTMVLEAVESMVKPEFFASRCSKASQRWSIIAPPKGRNRQQSWRLNFIKDYATNNPCWLPTTSDEQHRWHADDHFRILCTVYVCLCSNSQAKSTKETNYSKHIPVLLGWRDMPYILHINLYRFFWRTQLLITFKAVEGLKRRYKQMYTDSARVKPGQQGRHNTK